MREVVDDVDRFVFSHALIRDTLYERQSVSRRARAHLAVAHALEHEGSDPTQTEYHFLAARHLDRDGRAAVYSVQAAERAAAALAYQEAAGHYRRALESGPESCELLLALASAQLRAGDPASRATFIRAAVLAREAGEPEALAQAALGIPAATPRAAAPTTRRSRCSRRRWSGSGSVTTPWS